MRPHLADGSPSVQRLVERQLRNWELQRRQRRDRPLPEPFLKNFIAISRQIGSRGEAVAAELGQRLGWKVYDRELLDLMAGDEEYRKLLYSSVDERQHNWIDGLLVLCAPETTPARDDYWRVLCKVVLTIAHHESAIFVGRGAHLFLPPDVGLRVRIVARLEDRVAEYAKAKGVDVAQARRMIEKAEGERESSLRHHFGRDAEAPERFALTVNTSWLNVTQACEIILAAQEQRDAGPG